MGTHFITSRNAVRPGVIHSSCKCGEEFEGAPVQWRGDDRYCVSRHQNASANEVLDRAGEWVWEPIPSERTAEFIAATRFPLDKALLLAGRAAEQVEVNGLTAADVLARRQPAPPSPASEV